MHIHKTEKIFLMSKPCIIMFFTNYKIMLRDLDYIYSLALFQNKTIIMYSQN